MSVILAPPVVTRPAQRRADAATFAAVFVVVLVIVPARLIIRGLPFALTPAEAVGLCAVLWWFCAHFTDSLGAAKGATPVRTAIYLYLVAYLASYAHAAISYLEPRALSLADHIAVIAVAFVGIALLACDGVSSRERVDLVLKTVVVCGAIIGVIGGIQYLLTFDPTQFMNLPGTRVRSDVPAIVERNGLNRAASTTSHPIEFGVVSSMILPIALHYAFTAKQRGASAMRWWLCCALIGAGMVFSASRSPILGLAVAGLVLLIGWPSRRRVRAIIGLLGFLVIVRIAVPGVLGTITGLFSNLSSDDSVRWRTADYTIALDAIRANPLLGQGHGTWYPPYDVVFDNQYLLTAVEGGILGVATFVALFVTGIWSALRARSLTSDMTTRDLGLSLAAALVVPLVGSATFDLNAFETTSGIAFLFLGLSGALLRAMRKEAALSGEVRA
ncbi:O-antigen ligase family protein [Nonomuraea sp. 10N515B]|uniref:O-antigen ligase family protein n=1 Tax=Nonomuraea sp. 10N515B TaxID=3457422 RepID=UPI003FCC332C